MIIIRLDETHRAAILQHLLGLNPEDRRLRFCMTTSNSYIERYALEVMDLKEGAAFGTLDEDRLVALASIAPLTKAPGEFELAFSIDVSHRGAGLARKLVRTSIDYCRAMGATKLCMSCLRTNRKMQELARSFGLTMTITYDEAYAELGVTK